MDLIQKGKILIISLTLILPFLGCISEKKKSDESNDISYNIEFDADNFKLTKVTVAFTPKDSILYMGYGGDNLEKRWATFVHNLKVVNDKGQLVKVEERPDAKWKMHVSPSEKIILTYEVHLDHENFEWSGGIDGVAYSTDMGVFYAGRTLFIMNGEKWENIYVSFKLPIDWHVTTPWNSVADINNTFKPINYTDITNSILFAGTHKEVSIIREDFELIFVLGGSDIIANENEYRNLAEGVLDYYIELMGGIPSPSPDNPINKVVVVISPGISADGEAIGNNISILVEKDGDQFSKNISRFIFAHEFYHLWNGKSFRPNSEQAEWFKEGFTNYYTLKALHHVGILTDETYLSFLSNFFYQRYANDDGVGNLSMTVGEKKHNHWGLIYGGGMLVGIAQDIIIRNATDNEKNVDDLMRSLYQKYGGSNDSYTLEELEIMLSELSGKEQTAFFDSYILGTDKIPIEDYLIMAGFDAQIENGKLTISQNQEQTQKQQTMIRGIFGQINNDN